MISAILVGGPKDGQTLPDVQIGKSLHYPGWEEDGGEYVYRGATGGNGVGTATFEWVPVARRYLRTAGTP